jgi:hypothetical protein
VLVESFIETLPELMPDWAPVALDPPLTEVHGPGAPAAAEARHGGAGSAWKVCVAVPLWVVTAADRTSWPPGHQATNQPLAVLARTRVPSSSTSVVAVTSEAA